nr:hypothetical protein [Leifsonia flava]
MSIRTPRLLLEPYTVGHAERMLAGAPTDDDHWAEGYPFADELDVARLYLRIVAEHGDPAPFGPYFVQLRATGEAIGGLGFFGPPDAATGVVEFGYGLVPDRSRRRPGDRGRHRRGAAGRRVGSPRRTGRHDAGERGVAARHGEGRHDGGRALGGIRRLRRPVLSSRGGRPARPRYRFSPARLEFQPRGNNSVAQHVSNRPARPTPAAAPAPR